MQGRKMLLHFLHSLHPCNSAIAEEQKSTNAMDGVNADFAGAKTCPAADTCQSSYRNLHKIGTSFSTKS
ncbi:hypothetical protein EQU24_00385 [Methylotuvimicrobium buryatense]|uniref:Uncharacterized protein n=1 Tax=Methylotuvimicrobium buryatense TaxID=95641 RepID=A0A4P9UKM3_METBY|nr:hypothetical protein EQU24_00385 [Methylotuvimicrobium buryatense]